MSSLQGTDVGDAESSKSSKSSTTGTLFEDLSSELLASSFVSGTQMAKVLSENRRLRKELDETKQELDSAKKELQYKEMVKKMIDEDAEMHTRYWLPEEHQRFLVGLQKFGPKDMKAIAEYVGTRSTVQVRTHSQKYFLKLERHGKRLGDLGMPKDDDGAESSSPSVKRARSSPAEKPRHTSSPGSSAGSRGGDGSSKRHAHSHAMSSAHQSPLSDMVAYPRVPTDPATTMLSQTTTNYGVLGAAGLDVSASAGMVSGLDVSRGGLMFPPHVPFSSTPPIHTARDLHPASAGGGMHAHPAVGVHGWSMPGGMPGAHPMVAPQAAAIQLAQPWPAHNVNQVRMPVPVPVGHAVPPAGAQAGPAHAQTFTVPGQPGASSAGRHAHAHAAHGPGGAGAGVHGVRVGVAPRHASGPGPGPLGGQQLEEHLAYLQNLQ